jgi:hypothetical protein
VSNTCEHHSLDTTFLHAPLPSQFVLARCANAHLLTPTKCATLSPAQMCFCSRPPVPPHKPKFFSLRLTALAPSLPSPLTSHAQNFLDRCTRAPWPTTYASHFPSFGKRKITLHFFLTKPICSLFHNPKFRLLRSRTLERVLQLPFLEQWWSSQK